MASRQVDNGVYSFESKGLKPLVIHFIQRAQVNRSKFEWGEWAVPEPHLRRMGNREPGVAN